MEKDVRNYKQSKMTCAIACMLMVLEYYKIIPKASYIYEQKYFKSYHSRYIEGTPFSALAWHFVKNGLYTEIIHSEKNFFKNNIFDEEVYENLLNEYTSYLDDSKKLGLIVSNGVEINCELLKKKIDEDNLVILAGQVDNILHAILLCGYNDNKFIVCDPLYKQKRIMSVDEINNFMNTKIGKWCVVVRK